MSDPRFGSGPDEPYRGHEPGTPPPSYPSAPPVGQSPRPPMPALVHYLSIGLFVLVALQVVGAVSMLATMDSAVDAALRRTTPPPGVSAAQLESVTRAGVVGAVVVSIVLAVVFLWLTVMVRKGRNWARVTSTVFLSLGILVGLIGLVTATIVGVLMLLLEITVLVMLWLRPSGEYFRPATRPS